MTSIVVVETTNGTVVEVTQQLVYTLEIEAEGPQGPPGSVGPQGSVGPVGPAVDTSTLSLDGGNF